MKSMILISFVGILNLTTLYTGNIWTGQLGLPHKHTVETLAALPKCIAQTTKRETKRTIIRFSLFCDLWVGNG